MPGTDQVLRLRLFINQDLHGIGPVSGGNPGSYAIAGIHGNPPGSLESVLIALSGFMRQEIDHRMQAQGLQALVSHRHADKPPAELSHKIYLLRDSRLRGHQQVSFIFPAFVINNDDHLPGFYLPDYLFYGIKLAFHNTPIQIIVIASEAKQSHHSGIASSLTLLAMTT